MKSLLTSDLFYLIVAIFFSIGVTVAIYTTMNHLEPDAPTFRIIILSTIVACVMTFVCKNVQAFLQDML